MSQDEWKKSVSWIGVVAGSVIKDNNKYLLVQEKQKKAFGLWNLPAGYVDNGETIEQAAVREAKEEVGVDIELIKEIAIYHEDISRSVKHAFQAKMIGGELKPQPDEILDARWLTYEEVKSLYEDNKIRAPWIFDAISIVERSQL